MNSLYPAKDSTESYGTYSIRKGGCERFDSRSAKELLGYLSDLLDDETHCLQCRIKHPSYPRRCHRDGAADGTNETDGKQH
ncbi:hypothetical protein NXW50_30925, partial [Bacteroides thetaiotaomicron]